MQQGQDLKQAWYSNRVPQPPSRNDEGGLESAQAEIRALKLLVEQIRHSTEHKEQRESQKKNRGKKNQGKKVVAL
jgi:hypothetical protein